MYPKDPDIASLISSRICHDLISPIGAISNGLELMQLSTVSAPPEYELLTDSVENAAARINFFRIAFGPEGAGHELPESMVRQTLDRFYAGSRLSVFWLRRGSVPRPQAKLALLLVQCIESWLPLGGQIHVSEADGIWTLDAETDRRNLNAATLSHLTNRTAKDPLKPSEIQFEIARRMLADAGSTASVAETATGLSLRYNFNQP